jgi:hypothetical protein
MAMGKSSGKLPGGIGLIGQMAATTAGPEFEQALRPILEAAGPLPQADSGWRLAPAATADAKGHTLVQSNVPAAIAATRYIPGANGSTWPGHRCVPSMVKWMQRRCNLIGLGRKSTNGGHSEKSGSVA